MIYDHLNEHSTQTKQTSPSMLGLYGCSIHKGQKLINIIYLIFLLFSTCCTMFKSWISSQRGQPLLVTTDEHVYAKLKDSKTGDTALYKCRKKSSTKCKATVTINKDNLVITPGQFGHT